MTRYALGNWKMNTTLEEARQLFQALPTGLPGVRIGVAVPFPWLVPLATGAQSNTAWIGAQDVSAETAGAFTGEVSMNMLAPYCDFVLIGHSERRQCHPESPEHLQGKIRQVIAANRTAVLCVGENLQQRKAEAAYAIVRQQLHEALADLSPVPSGKFLIAYEPVWAIGTGVSATPQDALDMGEHIELVLDDIPATRGIPVPILYGGSVTPENTASFLDVAPIDGVLVGGASLDSTRFRSICETATR